MAVRRDDLSIGANVLEAHEGAEQSLLVLIL